LQVFANRLVPWDDYDDDQVRGMTTDDELDGYEFFRVYACYSILRSCFGFVDTVEKWMEDSLKYYQRRRGIRIKACDIPNSYMSHRYHAGIISFNDRFHVMEKIPVDQIEPTVPQAKPVAKRNKGVPGVKPVAHMKAGMSMRDFCASLRKELKIDECTIIEDTYLKGKTGNEIEAAMKARAEQNRRITDALRKVKEELTWNEEEVWNEEEEGDSFKETIPVSGKTHDVTSVDGKKSCIFLFKPMVLTLLILFTYLQLEKMTS
jgi:hypothetical protein